MHQVAVEQSSPATEPFVQLVAARIRPPAAAQQNAEIYTTRNYLCYGKLSDARGGAQTVAQVGVSLPVSAEIPNKGSIHSARASVSTKICVIPDKIMHTTSEPSCTWCVCNASVPVTYVSHKHV